MEHPSKAYTYILACADGSFYTGWTNDLEKRLATHNAGKGGKYTRTRLPVRLAYYEEFDRKTEAQSREWHIKRMSHEEKAVLVADGSAKTANCPTDAGGMAQ